MVRFSIGGWCSDNDYNNTANNFKAVTTGLSNLFQWSGATGLDLDPEPCVGDLGSIASPVVRLAAWAYTNGYAVTAAPYKNATVWAKILTQTVDPGTQQQMFENFNAQLYGNPAIIALLEIAIALQEKGGNSTGIADLAAFMWPGWAPCEFDTWNNPGGLTCEYTVGRSSSAVRNAAASIAATFPGAGGSFLWNAVEFGQPENGCPTSLKKMRQAMELGAKHPFYTPPASCTFVGGPAHYATTPYAVRCVLPASFPLTPQPGSSNTTATNTTSYYLVQNTTSWALTCEKNPSNKTTFFVLSNIRILIPCNESDPNCRPGPGRGESLALLSVNGTANKAYFLGINSTTGQLMIPFAKLDDTFRSSAFEWYPPREAPDSSGSTIRMRVELPTARPWCQTDGVGAVYCSVNNTGWSEFVLEPVLTEGPSETANATAERSSGGEGRDTGLVLGQSFEIDQETLDFSARKRFSILFA